MTRVVANCLLIAVCLQGVPPLFGGEAPKSSCECFVMNGEIYGSKEAAEEWLSILEFERQIEYSNIPALLARYEKLIEMHPDAPINAKFAERMARPLSFRRVPEGEEPLSDDFGASAWQRVIDLSSDGQYLRVVGLSGLAAAYSRMKEYDKAAAQLSRIIQVDPSAIRRNSWEVGSDSELCGSQSNTSPSPDPDRVLDATRARLKALNRLSWMVHHSGAAFEFLKKERDRNPDSEDIAVAHEMAVQRLWFAQTEPELKLLPAVQMQGSDQEFQLLPASTFLVRPFIGPLLSLAAIWIGVFTFSRMKKQRGGL